MWVSSLTSWVLDLLLWAFDVVSSRDEREKEAESLRVSTEMREGVAAMRENTDM